MPQALLSDILNELRKLNKHVSEILCVQRIAEQRRLARATAERPELEGAARLPDGEVPRTAAAGVPDGARV